MTLRQRVAAIYEHTKVDRIPFLRGTILSIKTFAMISYECNKRTIVVQLQFIHRVFTGSIHWVPCFKRTWCIIALNSDWNEYLLLYEFECKHTQHTEAYKISYSGRIRHMGFIMACTWVKIDLQLVFLPTINRQHSFWMFKLNFRQSLQHTVETKLMGNFWRKRQFQRECVGVGLDS